MKKWIGGLIFFVLSIFFFIFFPDDINLIKVILGFLFIFLSILFLIISLIKKETPIAVSIILLIFSVLFVLILGSLIILNNLAQNDLLYTALENAEQYSIAVYYPEFNSEGNIIKVYVGNNGDPIQLTLNGNSLSKTCLNPEFSAETKDGDPLTSLDYIQTNQTFYVVYDCENSVSDGDAFRGTLSFEYLANGQKSKYEFPVSGYYDDW